jgi:hypothetical protein
MLDIDSYRKKKAERVKAAGQEIAPKSYADPRFWKLKLNETTGRGEALIRFLPTLQEDKTIQVFEHFVKTSKGIASCLCKQKSIKKQCPVCDKAKEAYENLPKEEATNICKNNQLFANDYYYTNILVIDDKENPENNGKVFLYKMSKTIYQILSETDETYADAFDIIDGKDFVLKCIKRNTYNYDSSYFVRDYTSIDGARENESKNAGVIEGILNKTYDLNEWRDEATFDKANMDRVRDVLSAIKIGNNAPVQTQVRTENVEPTPAPIDDEIPSFDTPTPASNQTHVRQDATPSAQPNRGWTVEDDETGGFSPDF